jgi:hypothetical protein
MKRIALACILALAGTAVFAQQPVQLASLASVDGKILVNKGKGFVAAKPGTALVEGDRLIALEGSRAAVVFPDGCVTQIKENSLLALEKGAGCSTEAVRTGGAQPLRYAQAIGGPSRTPPPPPSPPPPQTLFGGLGPGAGIALGLGGLAVGAMVADSVRRSGDRPLSPQ